MISSVVRVAVDLSLERQTGAGTARYARALVASLRDRDDVEVVVLGAGPTRERGSLAQKVDALIADCVGSPLLLRRRARAERADVLHVPIPRGPLTPGRPPLVVTLHDLAFLTHRETLGRWNRHYSARAIPRLLAAADRIVTVSRTVAGRLSEFQPDVTDKVRVVPQGIDLRFRGVPRIPSPVEPPYVLFVGTREPRKNLARLAEATRLAGLPLVVAGDRGWGDAGVADAIQLGRVDDDTLHALYAAASCCAIPSLDEGFGLPAVEAMAAGCPVVAAARGALPEICGEAAILVDPLDPAAIAGALERAIAERNRLVPLGRARAAEFDWARAAAALVDVYRELL